MKHVIYIMHVPWGWIKQRPHFFAEYLSYDFDVFVKYRRSNTVKSFNTKKSSPKSNLHISGFRMIPFEKLPILKYFNFDWVNKLLFRYSTSKLSKYNYIWITSPTLYNLITDLGLKSKIIYDCMDDALEFPTTKSNKALFNKTFESEKQLISNSSFIICSSEYLKNVLTKRYKTIKNISVINNAINLYTENIEPSNDYLLIEEQICSFNNPFIYIGTISEWFDFESIINMLEKNVNINVVLIGPIQDTTVPFHERLHALGTIRHEYIYNVMNCAKALIMPFRVNELINSVNPVKLYEYIYSGKPIISVYYNELEKFKDYVFLYNNNNELIEISKDIVSGAKKTSEDKMKQFALKNTWSDRYNQIKSIILNSDAK